MALMLLPVIALAQIAPVQAPASSPTLTPTVSVVTLLSMVAGVLTNWIQTGTLLGRWITPKSWLPDLTMISTSLGGFLGYLLSQAPVSLSGTALFYGTMAAVAALVAGATPGLAIHVHATLTAQRRTALRVVATSVTAVALAFGLAVGTAGCALLASAAPPAVAAAGCIIDNAVAGKTVAQIIVICGGDVAQVVSVLESPQNAPKVTGTKAKLETEKVKVMLTSGGPQS